MTSGLRIERVISMATQLTGIGSFIHIILVTEDGQDNHERHISLFIGYFVNPSVT